MFIKYSNSQCIVNLDRFDTVEVEPNEYETQDLTKPEYDTRQIRRDGFNVSALRYKRSDEPERFIIKQFAKEKDANAFYNKVIDNILSGKKYMDVEY